MSDSPRSPRSPKKKGKSKFTGLLEGSAALYGRDYEEYNNLGIGEERLNKTVTPKLQETFMTINAMLTLEGEDKIFSVNVLVKDFTTIDELIDISIKKFNDEKLKIENKAGKVVATLSFKEDEKGYKLKPCKKNGKPKDYPPFLGTSCVSDTQATSLALVFPNSAVELLKPSKKDDSSSGCKDIRCTIY